MAGDGDLPTGNRIPEIFKFIRQRVPEARQTYDTLVEDGDPDDDPKGADLIKVIRRSVPGARINFQESMQRDALNIGWFGRFFGDINHSANNIVGASLLGLLAMLTLAILAISVLEFAGVDSESLKAIVLTILALIGTTIGYLFGRRDNDK